MILLCPSSCVVVGRLDPSRQSLAILLLLLLLHLHGAAASSSQRQHHLHQHSTSVASVRPHPPQLVGESNVTHFWMPGVSGVVVMDPFGDALLRVDLNGDGTPPTNCSRLQCPPRRYVRATQHHQPNHSSGPAWTAIGNGAFSTNGLVRLPNFVFRGYTGITIDVSTNTSGNIGFEDWTWIPGHGGGGGETKLVGNPGVAPLTGLPKVAGPRLQIMPSGVQLRDNTTRMMMAYGALDGATSLASFLLVSRDEGSTWRFRKSFAWMPGMPSARGCRVHPRRRLPPVLVGHVSRH
jgi:hypothetical protein